VRRANIVVVIEDVNYLTQRGLRDIVLGVYDAKGGFA
jgi:hypothetical protein